MRQASRCGACTSRRPTRLADALVPAMVARGRGRVVLIGSRVAQGMPGRSQYAATKAALVALARSWAARWRRSGVTINVVSPAATATAMLDDPGARRQCAARCRRSGRLIEPAEIAELVAFLLSPAAAAITGQEHPDLRRRVAGVLTASLTSSSHSDEDRQHPRIHAADPLRHPQRVHRLLEDDAEPRRRGHRRHPRRPAGGRLRLQFQRPLRPGRTDPRALRAARSLEADPAVACRRCRREPRPASHLGANDDQREARRPRRALGRRRHDRHGGLGRGREDRRPSRSSSCLPSATASGKPNPRVFVYAAGGYYYPGKGLDGLAARDDRAISSAATPSSR